MRGATRFGLGSMRGDMLLRLMIPIPIGMIFFEKPYLT